jgi:hypothetical protein
VIVARGFYRELIATTLFNSASDLNAPSFRSGRARGKLSCPQLRTVELMSEIATTLHRLANRLPIDASWEDVRYEVELLASIDRGLRQANSHVGLTSEALMESLGLIE